MIKVHYRIGFDEASDIARWHLVYSTMCQFGFPIAIVPGIILILLLFHVQSSFVLKAAFQDRYQLIAPSLAASLRYGAKSVLINLSIAVGNAPTPGRSSTSFWLSLFTFEVIVALYPSLSRHCRRDE